MAKNNTKKKAEAIEFKFRGTLNYFGYGKGKFGSEEQSQIAIIPDDAEQLRKELETCYDAAEIDTKWRPDFITKKSERLNLKSRFDVIVIAAHEGDNIRTNVKDFGEKYGIPAKGTRVKFVMKFKPDSGSLYPVALMFEDDLDDIEYYNLDNLFDF